MNRLPRALLLTAGLALLARLALLALRGDYLVYDEAYYLLLARSLREHGAFHLNGLPHVALSPLQPLLVAAVSLAGMPDLLASRALAAVCGALLPVAVWAVAVQLMPPRPALVAAVLVASASTLMTFTPFFPGASWNLYFGSEPLYLLLVFGGLAAAMRAAASGSASWFALTGLAAGAAFLARAEGLVLGPLLFATAGLFLIGRRRAWGAWSLGVLLALAVSAPYLGYLRAALGRWALSGRVQAVTAGPAPRVESTARRGGAVLDDFVWGGDEAGFREELYRLTPDGGRMRSQYWGVERTRTEANQGEQTRTEATGSEQTRTEANGGDHRRSFARSLWRGTATVVPPWFLVIAVAGIARVLWLRDRRLVWLMPPLLAAAVPVWVAYVEPRVLLPLVPLCALGAAGLWHELDGRLRARLRHGGRWAVAAAAAAALLLAWPAARDGWRARGGTTDLQRIASAQRAVGALLGRRLAPDATVMSWHPAVAVWAGRDWRVLPLEPLARIVPYARARGVTALALSRFHPSPLAQAPRPFTVLLLDGPEPPPVGDNVTLAPVEDGPLVFVGRLAPRP